MKTFTEFLEARDFLGREVPDFDAADLLQKTRKIREPDATPAVQMRLDTRNSSKASNITYDPQNGDVEVTYKDGTKRNFKGVKYPDAHRAGSTNAIDKFILDLESGRLGTSV
jgi:hypothetical protein